MRAHAPIASPCPTLPLPALLTALHCAALLPALLPRHPSDPTSDPVRLRYRVATAVCRHMEGRWPMLAPAVSRAHRRAVLWLPAPAASAAAPRLLHAPRLLLRSDGDGNAAGQRRRLLALPLLRLQPPLANNAMDLREHRQGQRGNRGARVRRMVLQSWQQPGHARAGTRTRQHPDARPAPTPPSPRPPFTSAATRENACSTFSPFAADVSMNNSPSRWAAQTEGWEWR